MRAKGIVAYNQQFNDPGVFGMLPRFHRLALLVQLMILSSAKMSNQQFSGSHLLHSARRWSLISTVDSPCIIMPPKLSHLGIFSSRAVTITYSPVCGLIWKISQPTTCLFCPVLETKPRQPPTDLETMKSSIMCPPSHGTFRIPVEGRVLIRHETTGQNLVATPYHNLKSTNGSWRALTKPVPDWTYSRWYLTRAPGSIKDRSQRHPLSIHTAWGLIKCSDSQARSEIRWVDSSLRQHEQWKTRQHCQ